MANNQWTNNRDVKLVGQTSAVPAPDYKAAQVVEYSELHDTSVVMSALNAPSEAANGAPQVVSVDAVVASVARGALSAWDYDMSFHTEMSDVLIGVQNTVSTPPSGSLEVVFPAGVKAGQTGIVKAHSGGAIGILKITVI